MKIRLHTHPGLELKAEAILGVGHVIIDGAAYSEARAVIEDLAAALEESHEVYGISEYHVRKDCSYCAKIKRARELLEDNE